VELHLKSRSRRFEVLQNYSKKESIHMIWYVFPKERFGHALFESCAGFLSTRPKHWLCWSLLDELLDDFAVLNPERKQRDMNRNFFGKQNVI